MSERARISSLTQRVAAAVAAADTQKLAVIRQLFVVLSQKHGFYMHMCSYVIYVYGDKEAKEKLSK